MTACVCGMDGHVEELVLSCTIPLSPRSKQRPRFANGRVHTSRATVQWERDCRVYLRSVWTAPPLDGLVRVDIVAVFKRPRRLEAKRHPDGRIPKPSTPDWDNVAKIVGDSGNKIIWSDDGCIWDGRCRKYYAARNEQPGVELRVWRTTNAEA